jgi:hypothetical protein
MDYTHLRFPVLESRLDWITCTARRDGSAVELMNYADRHIRQSANSGNRVESYKNHGYEGWRSGNWAWGWGKHGALVVVSQADAQASAGHLALLADHWSRCDYCVTVRDVEAKIDPTEDYYESWRHFSTNTKGIRGPTRIQTLGGGATITVGERSGAYYSRVYNKTLESEGEYPDGCWRWELELKRHASEGQQRRWLDAKPPDTYAMNLIAGELDRYNLTVPWDKTATIRRDPEMRPRPDVERTLRWLEKQVRPSVERCVEAAGVESVLAALNLPTIEWKDRPDLSVRTATGVERAGNRS